jgi:ABC-type oligopeptide transport system substrate-binding subunit
MRAPWNPALVVLAAAIAAAGCGAAATEGRYFGKTEPPAGQELRYISGSEPESLDPQLATGQPEARILLALFEGLTEFEPRTAVEQPALAERWEIADGNTRFVFHLRRDARWSDGSPLTAHDVVYTFRRGLDPALASRNAYLAYDILNAQAFNEGGEARAEDIGVHAIDDYTVEIRTVRPLPFLPRLLGNQFFRIVPRRAIEAHGDRWTQPGRMVTSGPFVLETWRPYDRIVVVRNRNYWGASAVRLDRITFYPLEEHTSMMNLYKAGEVDALYNHVPPVAWLQQIIGRPDHMDEPEALSEFYYFNVKQPPMDDARVRKAFNMAIDKTALAQVRQVARPLTGFVPEGVFPGYPHPAGDAFDPARARALLAAAGYRNAQGEYDPAAFPIDRVELTYNTQESNRLNAEFVQAQWKQNLGLTIPLKNMEFRTLLPIRARKEYLGIVRGGWAGDYLDPFSFLALFSTDGGENGAGWFDPAFLRLLQDANREPDPGRRYALLAKAEAYLLDVQPVIPLYTPSTNWMKKPYVKGMYPNPLTMHAWQSVYIEHDPGKWDQDATR